MRNLLKVLFFIWPFIEHILFRGEAPDVVIRRNSQFTILFLLFTTTSILAVISLRSMDEIRNQLVVVEQKRLIATDEYQELLKEYERLMRDNEASELRVNFLARELELLTQAVSKNGPQCEIDDSRLTEIQKLLNDLI